MSELKKNESGQSKPKIWLLNISEKDNGVARLFDEKFKREFVNRYEMIDSASEIKKNNNDLVVELHSTYNGLFFATAIKFYKFQEVNDEMLWQSIGESSIAIYKDTKYFDIARDYYKITKRSLEQYL